MDRKIIEYLDTHITERVALERKVRATEFHKAVLILIDKDHNQLTLTDAREIYNMRKWIQSRGDRNNDFIELSCDEEAEHITEAVFREPVAVPKEPEDNEGYTDWDLEYSNLLRRR